MYQNNMDPNQYNDQTNPFRNAYSNNGYNPLANNAYNTYNPMRNIAYNPIPNQGAFTYQQITNPQPVQNPNQQQQQQQYPNNNSVVVEWIRGLSAAESYRAAPGQTAIFLDSLAPADHPVMYFVSSDETGRPLPVETYDLIKRTNVNVSEPNIDLSEYVKKSEVEEFIMATTSKAIDKKMSEMQFRPNPSRNNPNNQNNQNNQGRSDK